MSRGEEEQEKEKQMMSVCVLERKADPTWWGISNARLKEFGLN